MPDALYYSTYKYSAVEYASNAYLRPIHQVISAFGFPVNHRSGASPSGHIAVRSYTAT